MRVKTCPTCGIRFLPTKENHDYCSDACKQEHLDQLDRFRRRAGKVRRNWQFSDDWKSIIRIMKERDIQYPEAVKIYESENKK